MVTSFISTYVGLATNASMAATANAVGALQAINLRARLLHGSRPNPACGGVAVLSSFRSAASTMGVKIAMEELDSFLESR